jgi:hypothetical protein
MDRMPVTRREVERELDRKTASITHSISRIKQELSLPSVPMKSAIKDHPLEIMLGAVAVGLAAGWLAVGKKKKKNREPAAGGGADKGFDAAEFLQVVRAAKASGLSEERAVEHALVATSSAFAPIRRAPQQRFSHRLGDHLLDMADAVIKTALRVATREAAAWVAETVARDKKTPSQ